MSAQIEIKNKYISEFLRNEDPNRDQFNRKILPRAFIIKDGLVKVAFTRNILYPIHYVSRSGLTEIHTYIKQNGKLERLMRGLYYKLEEKWSHYCKRKIYFFFDEEEVEKRIGNDDNVLIYHDNYSIFVFHKWKKAKILDLPLRAVQGHLRVFTAPRLIPIFDYYDSSFIPPFVHPNNSNFIITQRTYAISSALSNTLEFIITDVMRIRIEDITNIDGITNILVTNKIMLLNHTVTLTNNAIFVVPYYTYPEVSFALLVPHDTTITLESPDHETVKFDVKAGETLVFTHPVPVEDKVD